MKNIRTAEELKKQSIEYSSFKLPQILGFDKSIRFCREVLSRACEDSLYEYAANVLEWTRHFYPKEWKSSWRYNVLLGLAYNIALYYEECYEAYKRAYDMIDPKPPQLLIALGECYSLPINEMPAKEALTFAQEAVKKCRCFEGVMLLRSIYKSLKQEKDFLYWDNVSNNESLESIQDLRDIPENDLATDLS